MRTGRVRARLCRQRHPAHHRLRAQRLQGDESASSAARSRVCIARKSNNFTIEVLALYACKYKLGEVSAFGEERLVC